MNICYTVEKKKAAPTENPFNNSLDEGVPLRQLESPILYFYGNFASSNWKRYCLNELRRCLKG